MLPQSQPWWRQIPQGSSRNQSPNTEAGGGEERAGRLNMVQSGQDRGGERLAGGTGRVAGMHRASRDCRLLDQRPDTILRLSVNHGRKRGKVGVVCPPDVLKAN